MVQAIYRRYRPQTFDEVVGQEQVTTPLKNALKSDRINHAYLFSGPRGCGKTTSARIMARCLNCEQGPTDTPCGTCPSCVELSVNGSGSLDVVEIDAASHNGVDDARALREKAFFAPVRDRYKIFILDEAHMVTTQGFNALLKLVEEPPEHVKFIFATTEPEKVITTIRSRTHHYPFRLVAPQILRNFLSHICDLEQIQYDNAVISLIVRAGAGSVRDSLSILDQVIAGCENDVLDYERTRHLLGYTDTAMLDAIVDAFAGRDGGVVYELIEKIVDSGQDPRRFVEDLLQKIRDLILISVAGINAKSILSTYSDEQLATMHKQAKTWGIANLNNAADSCVEALGEMVGATSARIHLELLCARIIIPSLSNMNSVDIALQTQTHLQQTGQQSQVQHQNSVKNQTINDSVSKSINDTPNSYTENLEKPIINEVKPSVEKQSVEDNLIPEKPAAPITNNASVQAQTQTPNIVENIPASVLEDSNLSVESHPQDEQFNTLAKTKKPGDLLAPASFGKPIVMPEQQQNTRTETPGTEVPKPFVEQQAGQSVNETFTQSVEATQIQPETVKEPIPTVETPVNTTPAQPVENNLSSAQSDLIRLRWEEILEKIKNDKKSTWILISRNAQPGSYDGQILKLHFDTKALAGMFSSGPHIQITTRAIQEILGIEVKINPTDEQHVESKEQNIVQGNSGFPSQLKTVAQEQNLDNTNQSTFTNQTAAEQPTVTKKLSLVEQAEKSFEIDYENTQNSSENFEKTTSPETTTNISVPTQNNAPLQNVQPENNNVTTNQTPPVEPLQVQPNNVETPTFTPIEQNPIQVQPTQNEISQPVVVLEQKIEENNVKPLETDSEENQSNIEDDFDETFDEDIDFYTDEQIIDVYSQPNEAYETNQIEADETIKQNENTQNFEEQTNIQEANTQNLEAENKPELLGIESIKDILNATIE